ncbi:butyrophilin subfamily 2 member A2-like isoform X1 [Pleurodeles waltl]
MKYFVSIILTCIAIVFLTIADSNASSPRGPIAFKVNCPVLLLAKRLENVVLSCQISPPEAAKQAIPKWYWSNSEPPPNDPCKNETFLSSILELNNTSKDDSGNYALHMGFVNLVDEGNYICCLKSLVWKEGCSIELVVESGPIFEIGKTDDGEIYLVCITSLWYREMELEGGNGEKLSFEKRMENGLYIGVATVHTAGSYTCHVKSPHKRKKTITVIVAESLQQKNSYMVFWIPLGICTVIGLCIAIKWICKKVRNSCPVDTYSKETKQQMMHTEEENQNNQNETESLTQQDAPGPFTEVPFILDKDSASNNVDISSDQKRVKFKGKPMLKTTDTGKLPVAFGKDWFTKGKYYWGMHVGKAKLRTPSIPEDL